MLMHKSAVWNFTPSKVTKYHVVCDHACHHGSQQIALPVSALVGLANYSIWITADMPYLYGLRIA